MPIDPDTLRELDELGTRQDRTLSQMVAALRGGGSRPATATELGGVLELLLLNQQVQRTLIRAILSQHPPQ